MAVIQVVSVSYSTPAGGATTPYQGVAPRYPDARTNTVKITIFGVFWEYHVPLWISAGLYLLVTPGGAKQWRLRYTAGGRESMLSLGSRRSGSGRNLQITPNGLLKAISTRELAEKAFD